MRALVTGGAGFIGSHVVDTLVENGWFVRVIDDLSTGQESYINKNADFLLADLCKLEEKTFISMLEDSDYVFHLAALPRIVPSYETPLDHQKVNVDLVLKLLESSKLAKVKKIIFSGSSAVFGSPKITPTKEADPVSPLNPYALQKYTAEQYGLMIGKYTNVPFISLRYMNPFGPRSFNVANPFNAYSSVVGIFEQRFKNNLPLLVTGDGNQKRDFVFVKDVAKANMMAALSNIDFGILNVGTGVAFSILEIAKLFNCKIEFIEKRPGEADITLADISEIVEKLNWQPEIFVKDYVAKILEGNT